MQAIVAQNDTSGMKLIGLACEASDDEVLISERLVSLLILCQFSPPFVTSILALAQASMLKFASIDQENVFFWNIITCSSIVSKDLVVLIELFVDGYVSIDLSFCVDSTCPESLILVAR